MFSHQSQRESIKVSIFPFCLRGGLEVNLITFGSSIGLKVNCSCVDSPWCLFESGAKNSRPPAAPLLACGGVGFCFAEFV